MMMLTGYLYVHLLAKLPRIRHQVGIHVIFWLCAVGMMPLTLDLQVRSEIATYGGIEVEILFHLISSAGIPIIFLGSNILLIQIWYGRTRGPSAHDPYFLFGASNVGALITLIAYPVVAEPVAGIERLSFIWSVLFACLGILLFISALSTTRDHPDAKTVSRIENQTSDIRTVWIWGSIAFVSSSLMLAITTRLGMEFGSTPLLWIIPVALYLVTYLAGFQSKPMLSDRAMVYVYPLAVFTMVLVSVTRPFEVSGPWPVVALLLSFTMICLHLHRRLYSLRPDTSRLTVFYLTLALAGVFGGAFNAFFAPTLMKGFYELHLVALAAAALPLLKNKADTNHAPKWIGLGLIAMLVTILTIDPIDMTRILNPVNLSVIVGLGALLMIRHQLRILGISLVCTVTVITLAYDIREQGSVFEKRSFFSIHKISQDGPLRTYINGSVAAGGQFMDRSLTSPEPLYQYHQTTSLGHVGTSDAWNNSERIGILGLGVGSMLAYRSVWQQIKVYEIDPEIISIALDPTRFTFVKAFGSGASIISGDPRTVLEAEKPNRFDVLLIDAGNSGETPPHLLTVEAFSEYVRHLDHDGFIAINATSDNFNLRLPISAAAEVLGFETYALETGTGVSKNTATGSPTLTVIVSRPGYRPLFTHDGWGRVEASPDHLLMDDSMDIMRSVKPFSRPF